ncbi:MAG: branched-chain amino acid ABC transporter permease [Flexilinea sp.]
MKKFLSKSINFGIVAGVILIFCEMINLTSTMAVILEKLFNSGKTGSIIDPLYMRLVTGLIVFFTAFSFLRSKNGNRNRSSLSRLIASLIIGITSGIVISLLNIVLGSYLEKGQDIRIYLDALSPDVIRTFLFQTDITNAVLNYFLSTISGSLIAFILFWIAQKTNLSVKISRSVKHLTGKVRLNRLIAKYPVIKVIFIILLIVVVFAIPVLVNAYTISVLGIVLVYAMMGLGLNLIVGLSGQLVFGYVAFYALGAYTFGLLTAPKPFGIEMNFWLALIISVVIAGFGGLLVGLPIMNLRGDYLAIVTLGFAEIVRILINSNLLADYTGGPQGIKNIGQPTQPPIFEKYLGKPLEDHVWFLYLIIFVFLIVLYVAYRLQYSRTGRSWEAMREDETVAQACGVSASSYKVLAIVIGAAIAGAAGAMYASRNTYTGPSEYAFMVSVNALAVVVVGGMGSIPGTLLGAFIIKGLPELLRDLENYRMVVFGALLIVMMIIRPEGIWPVKRRKLSVAPESIDVLKEDLKP